MSAFTSSSYIVTRLAAVISVLALAACETTTNDESNTAIKLSTAPQVRFASPPELNMPTEDLTCTARTISPAGQPLHEPQVISPNPRTNTLETALVIREKERCVPTWSGTNWQWSALNLRTYGFPIDHDLPINPADPDDPNIAWSAPGPTLVLHPGSAEGVQDGSRFRMTLHNYMDPDVDHDACDKPHTGDPTGNPSYTFPNCFHGNNVTNFHFHGFHISPQAHQDNVLLSLYPYGTSDTGHAAHGRGDSVIGSYDYDVPPLPWNQAPGTHWYHAHKHGATALQVLNGLVGTFEVRGDFDQQLSNIYGEKGQELKERLMVVQQLDEALPGIAHQGTRPKLALVNGQARPVVTMRPEEVQRWRFVGATMQLAGALEIGFEEEANGDDPDPEIRQIAMDGVQFHPTNYCNQPILVPPAQGATPDGCVSDALAHFANFELHPGNRIDILIKAPKKPGTYHMTQDLLGELPEDMVDEEDARADIVAALTDTSDPALLTLVVLDTASANMKFPTEDEFPKLPGYLDDLTVSTDPNFVNYQMKNRANFDAVEFAINDKQYDPMCIDEQFTLGKPEHWRVTNDSDRIEHPFHIHTNPFQLVSSYDGTTQTTTTYDPPYVWMDTVALPKGTTGDLGYASIYYEAVDFTGEFVNHCHILGHEDRGMMQNVSAVCPNGNWGNPVAGGDECVNANIVPPMMCKP